MEDEAKPTMDQHVHQQRAQHMHGTSSDQEQQDGQQIGCLEEPMCSQPPSTTNNNGSHNNNDVAPSEGYILALTERSSEFMAAQQMGNDLNRQDKAIKRAAAAAAAATATCNSTEINDQSQTLTNAGISRQQQERRSGPSAGYILALTERSSEFMTEVQTAGVVDNGNGKENSKVLGDPLASTSSSNPENGTSTNDTTIPERISEQQIPTGNVNSGENGRVPLSVPPSLHLKERRINHPEQNNHIPPNSGHHSHHHHHHQQQQQQQPGAFRERGINSTSADNDDEETGNRISDRDDNSQEQVIDDDAEESNQITTNEIEAPIPHHDMETISDGTDHQLAATSSEATILNNRNQAVSPQPLADQVLIEATLVASATTNNTPSEPIESESFHTSGAGSAFAEAKPMDDADMASSFFKTKAGMLMICLLLTMLVVVIGLVVWHSKPPEGKGTSTPDLALITSAPTTLGPTTSATPTIAPTTAPTIAPTTFLEAEESIELLEKLNLNHATTRSILEVPESPQYLAFQWLRVDPFLPTWSTKELVQRFSLRTLYQSTNGKHWSDSGGWNEYSIDTLCSTWKRVYCNSDEDVYQISMRDNGLNGYLPLQEISLLAPGLKEIQMYYNDLAGPLLSQIGELTSLSTIYLGANSLSGTLPTQIGKLSLLYQLDLEKNYFSGEIPKELSSNEDLYSLNLAGNSFSGQIPSEIFHLHNLKYLDLKSNKLSSALSPEVGKSLLISIFIEMNDITGSLPSQVGTMQEINHFDAQENRLSGRIPTEIGLATTLNRLTLGSNYFSGPLPSEVGLLHQLCEVSIANNRLHGAIPGEAGRLCYGFVAPDTTSRGEMLHVRGELWCDGSIEASQALDYMNTTFAKSVEAAFGTLDFFTTTLERPFSNHFEWNLYLVIVTAIFSGDDSPTQLELKNLLLVVGAKEASIEVNDPGTNQTMVGKVGFKAWSGDTAFRAAFNFSHNRFSGPIPAEMLGSGSFLEKLDLSSNFLSGPIPPAVGSTSDLILLLLANNSLTNIPSEVGGLSFLETLDVSSNRLQGEIPSNLGNVRSLKTLDVSNNLLGGSLPLQLGDLHDLRKMNLSHNQVTGSIPNFKFPRIQSLDLSFNAFSGSIPADLLHTVCKADMSNNQLSGTLLNNTVLACYRDIHFGMSTVSALLDFKLDIRDPYFIANEQQIGYVESIEVNAALLYDRVLKELYPSDFESVNMVLSENSIHYDGLKRVLSFALIAAIQFVPGSTLPASQDIVAALVAADFEQEYQPFELNISSAEISIDALPPVQMDLSFNKFSGSIPKELAALGSPGAVLRLQGNNFTGTLPKELCPWLCDSSHVNSSRFLEVDCDQITCSCDCDRMGV